MGVLPRIGRWASGPGAAVLTMAALLLLWEAAVVGLDLRALLHFYLKAEIFHSLRLYWGEEGFTVRRR